MKKKIYTKEDVEKIIERSANILKSKELLSTSKISKNQKFSKIKSGI